MKTADSQRMGSLRTLIREVLFKSFQLNRDEHGTKELRISQVRVKVQGLSSVPQVYKSLKVYLPSGGGVQEAAQRRLPLSRSGALAPESLKHTSTLAV